MKETESIAKAVTTIRDADAILIGAGAGMGVDSGLPDFRGNEGFWKAYPPFAKMGKSFIEMANPHWFQSNPKLAWAFYGHRLNLYRETAPHAGYTELLEIAKSKRGGYFVFTSNVDGHFQKAGYDEERIEECHGSIHHFQCTEPCSQDIWDAAHIPVIVEEESFEAVEPLPRCPGCGGVARPNILMFGDWSWNPGRTQAQENRHAAWLQGLSQKGLKLAVVEIGAGKAVTTVRVHSESVAGTLRGALIRVNPRDPEVPHAQHHISVPLNAAEAIRGIFALLTGAAES